MNDETEQLVRFVLERMKTGTTDSVFKALFESLPVPVRVQSFDLITLDCNQAFCEMIGRKKAELVGHSIDIYVPQASYKESLLARKTVVAALKRDGHTEVRVGMAHADGRVLDIVMNMDCVTLKGREVIVVSYWPVERLQQMIDSPTVVTIKPHED